MILVFFFALLFVSSYFLLLLLLFTTSRLVLCFLLFLFFQGCSWGCSACLLYILYRFLHPLSSLVLSCFCSPLFLVVESFCVCSVSLDPVVSRFYFFLILFSSLLPVCHAVCLFEYYSIYSLFQLSLVSFCLFPLLHFESMIHSLQKQFTRSLFWLSLFIHFGFWSLTLPQTHTHSLTHSLFLSFSIFLSFLIVPFIFICYAFFFLWSIKDFTSTKQYPPTPIFMSLYHYLNEWWI